MTPPARIVPTGPESFIDELVTIDADFFGGTCCEDCQRGEVADGFHHDEDEPVDIAPVLVRR